MAALAKLLGVLSLMAAFPVGLLGLWAVGSAADPDYSEAAVGEAFLVGCGFGSLALILAAVGSGVYVVGDLAAGGVWLRQRVQPAAPPVPERPYGASSRT